jgi:hypothetical protein
MIDYTTWCGTADVQARLSAAGVTLRDTTGSRIAAVVDEVTAEVARRTLRQFVADAVDQTRTYDGAGTAEIEIDEIVSLTGVQVTGLQMMPTYTLAGVTIVQEQNRPQTRLVVAQGSVPAFTTEGVFAPYPLIFPAGRQNISVTGRFGFAAQIPPDLWHAVCGEMAYRLCSEAIFDPAGRTVLWREGDEETRLQLAESDATKWHDIYLKAVAKYKRPSGRRLRNMRPRMA